MTITDRDRRALLLLGAALLVYLIVWWLMPSDQAAPVVAAATDVGAAERRLERTRQRIAAKAELRQRLEQWTQAVEARDRRLIRAETAARAQEIVLSEVRRIAAQQAPPIELSSVDPGKVEPYGEIFGEAIVSVTFRSSIEGLLNLLAELSQQDQLIATRSMQVTSLQDEQKLITVRLTVSGLVPPELVPKKQGGPRL